MDNKRPFYWYIVFFLLCIWQLPQLLVALVMLPFLGKKRKVADRHFNLCYECQKMSGGISLGPLAFVSPYSNKEETIAHETDGHTVDSKIFGPLYLLVIGIPSILWAATYSSATHSYYDFYTERLANKHAGLIVVNKRTLKFKTK